MSNYIEKILAEVDNLRNDLVENKSIMAFWHEIPLDYDGDGILFPRGEEREIVLNYFYPLTTNQQREWTQKDANKLTGPFVLVYLNYADTWGLALTAGGMDMTWEICEAYIELGYLPPAEFCDLPLFAEKWTDRKELIFQACKKSYQLVARWMDSRFKRLIETEDKAKKRFGYSPK